MGSSGKLHTAVASAVLALLVGPAWASSPVFTDVTAAMGINHVQWQVPDPRPAVMQAYMSGGAAAGDFNNDGWTDLYITRLGAPDILYQNLGAGPGGVTFQEVSASVGLTQTLDSNGAAWGDVDNDGDLDLYVTTFYDTRFYLYINDAGQSVERAIERGAAVSSPDTHYGYGVTFGDYDLDGFVDIHTTEWNLLEQNPTGAPSNARLLRNRGSAASGYFIDVTQDAGVAMDEVQPSWAKADTSQSFASRFSDLDGDGLPDLAIASDHGTSRLFWNNGDGTFEDGTDDAGVGSDQYGMGSAIGDVDGDGRMDWFVTSIYEAGDPDRNGNRLYRNEGDRTFSDATDAAGLGNGDWGWGGRRCLIMTTTVTSTL